MFRTGAARSRLVLLLIAIVVVAPLLGCARSKYRQKADEEAYCLIGSRQSNDLWDLPAQRVEPQPHSRMYMAAEQDCGPKPPDDPAANGYMRRPYCINNAKYYDKRGDKLNTENPIWTEYLPRDENNKIKLTQPLTIDLALLHSRDYQNQFESVYLTALDLSGNRFEFDTQWFGGFGADYTATGEDLGNVRSLDVTASRLGFSRNLAGGGQFATSILNSLAWDFGNNTLSTGTGAIVSTFTQPLLRGAFRHVRLESLTQSERNLLYSVRDFARFRRTFHVDIVTSYLSLLTEVQAIRNLQANLANLRQNLDEHEEYVKLGIAAQFQRDQVFQQYQNGRLSLLSAEQSLTESLDQFKFELGLPPWIPIEVDEAFLEPFDLVDPRLEELQTKAQELYVSLLQYLNPEVAPKAFLLEKFEEYQELREEIAAIAPNVEAELEQWESRIEDIDTDNLPDGDRLDLQQQKEIVIGIREQFDETRTSLESRERFNARLERQLNAYDQALPITALDPEQDLPPEVLAGEALIDAVGERLRTEIAELYVAQTQIRLFLIDVEPQLDIDQKTAISYAHANRLDLMNSKALVMDAYRRVEVAADALQSDLSITGGVVLGTDPAIPNAYRFDANNNTYTAGVQFDGPLNRLNERNAYRESQINYQQATRNFMAEKDLVANDVRSVLRQLELSRLSFQIARQQLVVATRQIEQAQFNLRRSGETDSNLTLFLLEALRELLDAKNNLISNWVSYRIQKMQLFASLELLYLDDQAQWINEEEGLEQVSEFNFIDPEYFPPEWVTMGDASMARLDETEQQDLEKLMVPPDETPPPVPIEQ